MDHWEDHKDIIRRLYVEERRPLGEVKQILEASHGFPANIPKSAYDLEIRKLGLLKKLKKDHWVALYQKHLQGDQKPFDLYLNGTLLYSWSTVWKELRRSRKTPARADTVLPEGLELRICSNLNPLPRTSRLPLRPSRPRPTVGPAQSPPASRGLMRATGLVDPATENTQVVTSADLANSESQVVTLTSTGSPHFIRPMVPVRYHLADGPFRADVKTRLETIPWNQMRLARLASIIGDELVYDRRQIIDGHSYAMIPPDDHLRHHDGKALAPLSDSIFPSAWDLEESHSLLMGPTPNYDAYHALNRIVYLLSNNLIDTHNSDGRGTFNQLLNTLLNAAPRDFVDNFFNTDSMSTRAVWQNLLKNSYILERTDVFDLLASVVLDSHIDWISGAENTMLCFAALSNNSRVMRKLLVLHAEIERPIPRFTRYAKAILLATKSNAQDCAKLLIEDCHPNLIWETFGSISLDVTYEEDEEDAFSAGPPLPIFVIFLDEVRDIVCILDPPSDETERLSLAETKENFYKVLSIFLANRADVDGTFFMRESRLRDLYGLLGSPLEWQPTCLDMSFYWDTSLFSHLEPYSKYRTGTEAVTRHGICVAAMQSQHGIKDYLETRPTQFIQETMPFLELILVEQFFIEVKKDRGMCKRNARIARSLFEYGINVGQEFSDNCGGATLLLKHLLTSMRSFGLYDDALFLLGHLLRSGAVIDAVTLECAVEERGTRLLDLLALHEIDLIQNGPRALSVAAKMNNKGAVLWLLDRGVDVNAEIALRKGTRRDGSLSNLGFLTVLGDASVVSVLRENTWVLDPPCRYNFGISLSMMQYLVEAGAKLRLRPSDSNAFGLIQQLIDHALEDNSSDTFEGLQGLFASSLGEFDQLSDQKWARILEFLIRIISQGKSNVSCRYSEFLETLLEKYCPSRYGKLLGFAISTDADADLIQRLISRTTNFNEYSIEDYDSKTPLQAAAGRCDQDLVSQLLSLGANVNAPAHEDSGATALQSICKWIPRSMEQGCRKMEMIRFLLANGADVNADPVFFSESALGYCVTNGDLNGTTLLLEHGADPNGTTYGGTYPLDAAVNHGRLDITHLLLQSGALSYKPGRTGYDRALESGNSTGKEIIQKHVAEQEELFRQKPELRAAHIAKVRQFHHKVRQSEYLVSQWRVKNNYYL